MGISLKFKVEMEVGSTQIMIFHCLWTQTGTSVTLSDSTVANPSFKAPGNPSVLIFSLVVTDSLGLASAPDEVSITVDKHRIYLPIIFKN